jgi:peroxiredoxin
MIGTSLPSIEVVNSDHEVYSLTELLRGAEAAVFVFTPFTFGEIKPKSMETLLVDISNSIELFSSRDIRMACLTREPASTNRHWLTERGFYFEVLSDANLTAASHLVGTMDMAAYLKSKKGIEVPTYLLPKPAIVCIGGEGTILSKVVLDDPENVRITTEEILKMVDST